MRRSTIWRLLSPIVAVVAIIAFDLSPVLLACHTDSLHFTIPNVTVEGTRLDATDGDPQARDLILQLSKGRKESSDKHSEDYKYRRIDQLSLSLANFDLNSRFLNLLFPSFYKYVKHSALDGRWVLPLSQRDVISDIWVRVGEQKKTEVIRYRNHVGIDEDIDDGTMTTGLEELFPQLDLFDDNIKMLDNRFAGPLSSSGSNYYKYYLTDTIISKGYVQKVVSFYPYYPSSYALQGDLYITSEDAPHITKSVIMIPNSTSLNFLDGLRITQEYEEVKPHKWMVKEEAMVATFRTHWNLLSLYVEQKRVFDNYQFGSANPLPFDTNHSVIDLSMLPQAEQIGSKVKKEKLLITDPGLNQFLKELKRLPSYKLAFEISDMITLDYIRTGYDPNKLYGGSLFDIGPISAIWGSTETEGNRLRLGGRTTGYFSNRFFLDGYVAYGTLDQKIKYSVTGTYSFKDKRYFKEEYPRHEVSLTYKEDIFSPGQIFYNNDQDNLLYNIGASYLASRSFRRMWRAEYQQDVHSSLSAKIFGTDIIDTPIGNLRYIKVQRDSTLIQVSNFRDISAGIELRWSPGERISTGSMQRHSTFRNSVQREVPIFYIRHESALPFLGSSLRRNRTEVQVDHRLWLGIAGRLDYQATIGKLWDNVPFPLLYTPPVNYSSLLSNNTFQLISPYEFIGDEWITIFAQWHMRGVILDRIPLIKGLKLRGVISTNILYGNTTKKNRQAYSKEIFILPTNATEMTNMGYLELGFGFENIFRILRIDAYYRVSPGLYYDRARWAIKAQLGLSL